MTGSANSHGERSMARERPRDLKGKEVSELKVSGHTIVNCYQIASFRHRISHLFTQRSKINRSESLSAYNVTRRHPLDAPLQPLKPDVEFSQPQCLQDPLYQYVALTLHIRTSQTNCKDDAHPNFYDPSLHSWQLNHHDCRSYTSPDPPPRSKCK